MSDGEPGAIRTLRRAYDAFSRGDFDAAIEIAHPEIVFIPPGGQQPIRGVSSFRAWMEPDALVEQRIDPVELRINGNKVLVTQRTRARGAASGIELDMENLAVWTLNEEGLATRVESFLPHEENEALAAAGLKD